MFLDSFIQNISLEPPMRKACRCIPLGYITQFIGLILSVFGVWVAYMQYYFVQFNPRTTLENYFDFLFMLGYLLCNISLIVGAYLYKRGFLIPWLIYSILPGIIFVSLKTVVYSEDERYAPYIITAGIFIIAIHGYFWLIVISLFIVIGKHARWAQQHQFDAVQHQQQLLQQKHFHHAHHAHHTAHRHHQLQELEI
ncbi:unnamed protein product [Lepeophtheirus salmonis]|uniref:(salmon louse) hypothetical protein n=1 Tax=Lepeophtheirus salmonis TaxID=72036 RepID=A0A7R8D1U9_LEPSM|nr:unnamed protein product [Lepeophtheirus salmonis]CAF2971872.1 unnamed protein product [Lepeophtheirus salmonis]